LLLDSDLANQRSHEILGRRPVLLPHVDEYLDPRGGSGFDNRSFPPPASPFPQDREQGRRDLCRIMSLEQWVQQREFGVHAPVGEELRHALP